MTLNELLPSNKDNSKECRCTSCRHKHKVGERSCVRTMKYGVSGWKDYCPKCMKGRSYFESPVEKKNESISINKLNNEKVH